MFYIILAFALASDSESEFQNGFDLDAVKPKDKLLYVPYPGASIMSEARSEGCTFAGLAYRFEKFEDRKGASGTMFRKATKIGVEERPTIEDNRKLKEEIKKLLIDNHRLRSELDSKKSRKVDQIIEQNNELQEKLRNSEKELLERNHEINGLHQDLKICKDKAKQAQENLKIVETDLSSKCQTLKQTNCERQKEVNKLKSKLLKKASISEDTDQFVQQPSPKIFQSKLECQNEEINHKAIELEQSLSQKNMELEALQKEVVDANKKIASLQKRLQGSSRDSVLIEGLGKDLDGIYSHTLTHEKKWIRPFEDGWLITEIGQMDDNRCWAWCAGNALHGEHEWEKLKNDGTTKRMTVKIAKNAS